VAFCATLYVVVEAICTHDKFSRLKTRKEFCLLNLLMMVVASEKQYIMDTDNETTENCCRGGLFAPMWVIE